MLNVVTINIDACHVPGLSLGCPEKGGTVPVSQLLGLHSAGLVIMQSSGFEGTESNLTRLGRWPAADEPLDSLSPSVLVCKGRTIPKD